MQVGKHLATIANAQRQSVLTVEEGSKLISHPIIEQNGLGPTLTGAQNIAVRETTTGNQALECLERNATGKQIAHMDVYCLETSPIKRCSHFNLAVNTLLPKHRNLRACTGTDIRRSNIFIDVVTKLNTQPRIVLVQQVVELFLGAVRVIPQRLNTVTGFRPKTLQLGTGFIHHGVTTECQAHAVLVIQCAHNACMVAQAGRSEEHTSELQSRPHLVCRLLLEKKKY